MRRSLRELLFYLAHALLVVPAIFFIASVLSQCIGFLVAVLALGRVEDQAWSAAAVKTHPQIVRETHVDYIRAGARVIITNTFASGRHMLAPAGLGVMRNSCDVSDLAPESRMCWHVRRGYMQPGYRCGADVGLAEGFERLIYHRRGGL